MPNSPKARHLLADIEILAYIRTPKGGFLTAMHDIAPGDGTRYGVATFNPGSNYRQVSLLRLVNANDGEATVSIQGIDDGGRPGRAAAPAGRVRVRQARVSGVVP